MLVLFETAGGFAIFKLLDKKKFVESSNLYRDFETPEAASRIVKLKHFDKFENTTEALASTTALIEGKLPKFLKKTLKKHCSDVKEELAVADHKLGNAIKEKLNLQCVFNTSVQELMRCIRSQLDSLLVQVPDKEMTAMALGLAHSLSRYKLKFSPDKIDTMVIQSINLLDELDKEINNYVMRCREWYGWHFPELSKIVTDNEQYIKTVKLMGARENAENCDMSDILMEHVEKELKEAAELSMGTEIAIEDVTNIQALCDEIIELAQYRKHLSEYMTTRMMALAPNLTILVGELVGARLISHAGSLVNLAKYPASTVQILGAEKALFRALKTRKDTPKYGLIYHAHLVGQATARNKGKMSRKLAAKTSLSVRIDALGENSTSEFGIEHRAKLEHILQRLNDRNNHRISGTGRAQAAFGKYHRENEKMQYPTAADSTLAVASTSKRKLTEESLTEKNEEEPKKKKKKKKDKQESSDTVEKIKIKTETIKIEEIKTETASETVPGTSQELVKKKKKKKRQKEEETVPETPASTEEVVQIVKKKRKREEQIVSEAVSTEEVTPISKKKKKKEKIKEEIVPETTFPIEKKKKKKKKSQDG